jgi:predicted nucleic acid-binding protein
MMTSNISELFLDSNILIYYTNPQLPQHSIAVQTLDTARQSGVELIVSPQILREYLSANTKFISAGHQITLTRIRENFLAFQNEFRVLDDNRQVLTALNNLLQAVPIAGKQIYDANIVATMQAYGIQHLLTNNVGHFALFSAIITVIPLQVNP